MRGNEHPGIFRARSRAEWIEWFEGRDICFAPVNDLREAASDPQAQARGMILRDQGGREHLGPVIKFRDEPAEPRLAAPRLGEHTDAMLAELGLAPERK